LRPAASKLRSAVNGNRPRFIRITSGHSNAKLYSFEQIGQLALNPDKEITAMSELLSILGDVVRILTFQADLRSGPSPRADHRPRQSPTHSAFVASVKPGW